MEHIQLVEQPPAAPGLKSCIVTGAIDGPFVSLGYGRSAHVHDLGWLLVSKKIAEFIAKAIGWAPESEMLQLRADLASSIAEADQLREQLRAAGSDAELVKDSAAMLDAFTTMVVIASKRIETPPEPEPAQFSGVTSETFR